MRRNFTPVKFALSEHPTTPSPLKNLPNPAPAAQQDNSSYKKQIVSVLATTSGNRVGVCVGEFQKGGRNRNLPPFVAFFGYFLQLLAESAAKKHLFHSPKSISSFFIQPSFLIISLKSNESAAGKTIQTSTSPIHAIGSFICPSVAI